MVEPERPQIVIQLSVACWIGKNTRVQAHASARVPTPTHTHALTRTNTHPEICKTYCFSTAKMISRTRLSLTLHVHCLSCLGYKFCHPSLENISLRIQSCDIRNFIHFFTPHKNFPPLEVQQLRTWCAVILIYFVRKLEI